MKRGLRRVVTWAIVGLLVLCVGTMLLAQIGGQQAVDEGWTPTNTTTNGTNAPVGTSSPAPTATAEPAATDMPEPTSPPTVADTPTATYAPTVADTPTAEPTATPRFSAAERAYAAEMVEITQGYGKALTGIGEESLAAGEDVTLLLDDDWKLRMALYMALLKIQGEAVREMAVPERFAALHEELLTAAGHFDRSADLMAEGIDELDGDLMGQAGVEMNEGAEAIRRAKGRLDEMLE